MIITILKLYLKIVLPWIKWLLKSRLTILFCMVEFAQPILKIMFMKCHTNLKLKNQEDTLEA